MKTAPLQPDEAQTLARMFERHRRRLYQWLRARVATREDAEDLLLEVFAKAARYVGRYDDQGDDGYAWLWRITQTILIDYYRASSQRHRLVAVDGNEEAARLPAAHEARMDPEILAHIARLPERQAQAVRAYYVQGWGVAEAGAAFGTTPSAITKLLERARVNLRYRLTDWAPG